MNNRKKSFHQTVIRLFIHLHTCSLAKMIGLPLPQVAGGKKNVPQTICLKMRQEWFCSFQRRRQASVHNDVSVMGWQIDWESMTLAWETHQWAAAQLWSHRAPRDAHARLSRARYQPDKWRHAASYAELYSILLSLAHDFNDGRWEGGGLPCLCSIRARYLFRLIRDESPHSRTHTLFMSLGDVMETQF